MTGNDFGRATQARFLLDAHLRGLLVSLPFDSFPGYDAVVDTGRRVYRVQIKGARASRRKSRPSYVVNVNRHLRHAFPRFDVLAVWCDGDAKWIIIPAKRCRGIRQLFIRPTGHLHRYADNWSVFR